MVDSQVLDLEQILRVEVEVVKITVSKSALHIIVSRLLSSNLRYIVRIRHSLLRKPVDLEVDVLGDCVLVPRNRHRSRSRRSRFRRSFVGPFHLLPSANIRVGGVSPQLACNILGLQRVRIC